MMTYKEQEEIRSELSGALNVLVQCDETMCTLYFDKKGRCFKKEGELSIPTVMSLSDLISWVISTETRGFIVSEYH